MIKIEDIIALGGVEIPTDVEHSVILPAIQPKEGKEIPIRYSLKSKSGNEYIFQDGEVFWHSTIRKERKSDDNKVFFVEVTDYFARPVPQDLDALKELLEK